METKKSSRKTAYSGPQGLKFLDRVLNGQANQQVEALKRQAALLKQKAQQNKA